MNKVKSEEEPRVFGFSHTRLGMEKTIEKQGAVKGIRHSAGQAVHKAKA